MDRPIVSLGQEVKDKITGYKGIVIAITNWLNGCQRITVQSQKLENGKPIDSQVFDTEQLEVLGNGVLPKQKKTGGPCDDRTALKR